MINLDESCLAKIHDRYLSADQLLDTYNNILSKLNLPDLCSLLASPFYSHPWKNSTKKQLLICSIMQVTDDSVSVPSADCRFKLGYPLHQWLFGLSDHTLTRQSQFHIKLLVGCASLE